jgi:hypothetical protein
MASIDFPDSPSVNDLFTVGDRTWIFTGDEVWQTVTSSVGAQGDKGGLRYAFDSVITVAAPASGFLRFNSATAASVTSIAISSENRDSIDVSNFFVELATSLPNELSVIKYYLVINGNANGSTTNFIFAVDTVDDNGTWLELSGEYLAGVIPADTQDLAISLSRVGDLGPTGPETSITIGTVLTSLPGEDAEVGVTGPPGSQILSFTLPQGPTGPPTSISVESDTGLPGSTAAASVTGPPGSQILSLTIPQGPTGPGGVYQYNVTGPTAPTAINGEPVASGDTWFNSETGRFYIYYDGYWVENTSSLVGATGLGYDGITSASSNSIPTTASSRTFLLNTTGALAIGSRVAFIDSSSVQNWMQGQITAINQTTRSVDVFIDSWNGSGTITSWNVSLAGINPAISVTGPISITGPIAARAISIADASASTSGVINTTTQTIAGNKTFTGSTVFDGTLQNTRFTGMTLIDTSASASVLRSKFIDVNNESNILVARQVADINTDGSSVWSWLTTPAGSRASNRSVERLRIDASGRTVATNELVSTHTVTGQLRAISGNFGMLLRNDGSDTYFLLTASGDQYGTWNALRPINFNNTTGLVSMGNGLNVSAGNISAAYLAPATGTTSFDFVNNGVIKVIPNATATYTATVPRAGTRVTLLIQTSGTVSYVITFGGQFRSVGTITTGTTTARVWAIEFASDGTVLYEVARTTTSMPA